MAVMEPTTGAGPEPAGARLRPLARILMFALLWLILAGTDPTSWIIGVPAVMLAAVYARRLAGAPPADLSAPGIVRFVPYFLWQSLLGGLDVARRVLRPRLRIAPGFHRYPLRLTNPAARVFFLDSVTLLPGTLSADMREGVIELHALDAAADPAPALADLERRVGLLFGEHLERPLEADRDA